MRAYFRQFELLPDFAGGFFFGFDLPQRVAQHTDNTPVFGKSGCQSLYVLPDLFLPFCFAGGGKPGTGIG